jgi:hypothetical protein
VYIDPVESGFETYLSAAIHQKKVPVVIVGTRANADFEIATISASEKAGWAKMVFARSAASAESASIKVTNIKTDEVVFAYAVNKYNSVHGKQSAAEACAKHLKGSMK